MKKSIFILTVAATFLAGTIFTNCQSSSQKVDDANAKVQDAKQDLKDAQIAAAEEWRQLKSESEIKIQNNETLIAELRAKMKSSGKKVSAAYAKTIEDLELKNKELKARIGVYDKDQSNWESFKREFNHDMDELGKALKDITVDNKN